MVNFVCIVFEQGVKMLTSSSMENLIVECNHEGTIECLSPISSFDPGLSSKHLHCKNRMYQLVVPVHNLMSEITKIFASMISESIPIRHQVNPYQNRQSPYRYILMYQYIVPALEYKV